MHKKDSLIESSHQLILYVEQEDNSYGPVQTGSYMVENYLDDFFVKKNQLQHNRLTELKEGRISPLAYYKDLVEIAEGDLACRVGVSKRVLRKHMTPKGFAGISVEQLRQYAIVFGIPVAYFFQIVSCDSKDITITHATTAIPELVISHIKLEPHE